MFTCDKCGKVVNADNDAVDLEFIMRFGTRPDALEKFVNGGARHLLPTGTCEGSPSRAQYLDGQPRDTRGYPYIESMEAPWRKAYEKLTEKGLEKP